MNEKLLGIGEASSYQQPNSFQQTIPRSPPNQPKSTKSLSSHSSSWPDYSIPSSPLLNSSPQTSLEGLALGNGAGKGPGRDKTPREPNTNPKRQKGDG